MEYLRLMGVWNAAVWFGAAVYYTFLAEPAAHSAEVKALLGGANASYFAGSIALVISNRYFLLAVICGGVAVAHLAMEWLYFGRAPKKWVSGLLAVLIGLTLLNALALQPKLKRLNLASHAVNFPASTRAAAAGSYRAWHMASTGLNVLAIGGLALYFWVRAGNASAGTRFYPLSKFKD